MMPQPFRFGQSSLASTVAVVVTTYNHSRFLADALDSVFAQAHAADEVIVVDDGSQDHPELVVGKYVGVRLIRQENGGLSSARNTGLAAARTDFILFLDADDLLTSRAIEQGLEIHGAHPGSAYVYGAYLNVNERNEPTLGPLYDPVQPDPFLQLLTRNSIGMHATVMFDRAILSASGGYDVTLARCEDYDVYLRLARDHRVQSHSTVVARYRFHGSNMHRDVGPMLDHALRVLEKHAQGLTGEYAVAAAEGRRAWRRHYATASLVRARDSLLAGRLVGTSGAALTAFRVSPAAVGQILATKAWYEIRQRLPAAVKGPLSRITERIAVPVGRWRMGDFARLQPASDDFGSDRGEPIDRYYVERFLNQRKSDIVGRVLEIGDDAYSRKFGGERITKQDILNVHATSRATIIGDLSEDGVLPEEAFDCVVLTQTLHLIYDLGAAVLRLYKSLRPGGVLLVTVPGISQIDRGEWRDRWYWSLTAASAQQLFGSVFGAANVKVASHGNVYVAVCFLEGLSQAEVDVEKLQADDPAYPVIVTVQATKRD
jgi:glycosyltransferase involved in cell wall biosynthesis/SAM-dependent methyltransferase